jgi:hypothetical protein
MDIRNELERLTRYIPMERLQSALDLPTKLCPEEFHSVLPSMVLAGDGINVQSLVLTSNSYLCEVRFQLQPAGRTSFDFVPKNLILNYRIDHWTQEVAVGQSKTSFEMGVVALVHGAVPNFNTVLNYAGHERDQWLREILEAIPIALLTAGETTS